MHTLKKQQGMATILLVLLIGISVMLVTATVAKTLVTNRESGVAAHAQTNAQLMGWAGVSAFRQYLLDQGKIQASNIVALNGRSITLRSDPNKKEIIAKNIRVSGCTAAGADCTVTANISSDNKTSKAAATIEATYKIDLKNETVSVTEDAVKASFGGDLTFAGGTISAETPNTAVVLNVDGDVRINTDFKLKNISSLTLNSTGNVRIVCSAAECDKFNDFNINAKGWVFISDGGNFGNIYAEDYVKLRTNVKAKNIFSAKDVDLSLNSTAQNIQAGGNVDLSEGAAAQNIEANGHVHLLTKTSANNIQARGYVNIELDSTVNGWIKSQGQDKYLGYAVYVLSSSKVKGTIYAKGDVRILLTAEVKNIYATGDIEGLGTTGSEYKKQASIAELNFNPVDINAISRYINDQLGFETRVDVTKYKDEANYIFNSSAGFSRVFLNKLKHPSLNQTYLYIDGKQYISDGASSELLGDGSAFSLGKYHASGSSQTYIGAICRTLNSSNECSSEIIGFLPRVSVENRTSGLRAFEHYGITNTWAMRSLLDKSSINNATFAPGIMYFDGNLEVYGYGNLESDATSNAFTNTFLAEGSINASVSSPRVYSPYNVIRNGTPALICNRTLKDTGNNTADPALLSPQANASKYLIPTNLCKNENEFSYSMNRDPATGLRTTVMIDGRDKHGDPLPAKAVPKLDLGYVALMSNKTIRVMDCSQIFGDVYARDTVEVSAGCGWTSTNQAITGTIATQGVGSRVVGNTFGTGTNYVIPRDGMTNAQGPATTETTTGPFANSALLTWSKYL